MVTIDMGSYDFYAHLPADIYLMNAETEPQQVSLSITTLWWIHVSAFYQITYESIDCLFNSLFKITTEMRYCLFVKGITKRICF